MVFLSASITVIALICMFTHIYDILLCYMVASVSLYSQGAVKALAQFCLPAEHGYMPYEGRDSKAVDKSKNKEKGVGGKSGEERHSRTYITRGLLPFIVLNV